MLGLFGLLLKVDVRIARESYYFVVISVFGAVLAVL